MAASSSSSKNSASYRDNVVDRNENNDLWEPARRPIEYIFEELERATNNFRDEIGRGGSGCIFSGILDDGSAVAVKRIENEYYGERVYQAEISALENLQHAYVVRLRGYSSHMMATGRVFFIVYNLFPNGSLDKWIYTQTNGPSRYLTWRSRYNVAVDVAKALAYLHHDCCPRILHLGIRPNDVLLNDNFQAVLSDFGLSELMLEGEENTFPTVRGVRGYIAPEMSSSGLISVKSDIFSYGQVLLDLFFGQSYVCLNKKGIDIYRRYGNTPEERRIFHAFLWKSLAQKKVFDLIDNRLVEDEGLDEKEANSLVEAALLCLEEDPEVRLGDIRQVVGMLEAAKHGGNGDFRKYFSDTDVTFENQSLRELARLPIKFRYQDLKKATNYFRSILGSGGSASVFKGILEDGTEVAVKRIDREIFGEWEYESEISAIASVQHVNLVRLRGYCTYRKRNGKKSLFIVYNLLEKGSLDALIFPKGGPCLSWKLRCRVAVDAAKALLYLHHDCHPQILHLDIKPANILLDGNFRAVVSDFGLSQLMKLDKTKFSTKVTRGTGGYIAPEWNTGSGISARSDIYSYGKVLLDLFFGQSQVCLDKNGIDIYVQGGNTLEEQRVFYSYMREKIKQKKLLSLIDQRLIEDDEVDETEANCLVHAALLCLAEDPKKRPNDMGKVVNMLQVLTKSVIDRHLVYQIGASEQHVEIQNSYNRPIPKEGTRLPREFSLEELKRVTSNFKHKIGTGSGGSGTVFIGVLEDGTQVAVKYIDLLQNKEYGLLQFEAEISSIASVRHVHLARLLGYCSHRTETMGAAFIVYNFFSNGSLDKWIIPCQGNGAQCISWKIRYRVAIDVAKALLYLHRDCHRRILHLDIKPANILLSDGFQAVVSHFGLSAATEEKVGGFQTKVRGTFGYIAPELGEGASEKSDIFSYGKVLMDLFFGQLYVCLDQDGNDIYRHPSRGGNTLEEYLISHALMRRKIEENRIMDLIDKRLIKKGDVIDEREANTLVLAALWCIEEDPRKRPHDMEKVIDMLQFMSLNLVV